MKKKIYIETSEIEAIDKVNGIPVEQVERYVFTFDELVELIDESLLFETAEDFIIDKYGKL